VLLSGACGAGDAGTGAPANSFDGGPGLDASVDSAATGGVVGGHLPFGPDGSAPAPTEAGAPSDATAPADSSSSSPADAGSAGDASGSVPASDGGSWLTVTGNKVVDPAGHTVILRGVSIEGLGQQSATSIGVDGVLDKVTNTNDPASNSPGWYARIVRLPVDPGADQNYVDTILKPAVEYATSKGLYAIVDLHYVDNPYNLVNQVNAFWTMVAPLFKDYPNVFYEPFNESNQQDSWDKYKPTMQAWVDLIRKYAPSNIIVAGSPSWDQTMGGAATNPLTGGNIVYTVHMYAEHYASAGLRQQVEQCAAAHPVLMTEWGFCSQGCTDQPGQNTDLVDSYGKPMLTWLEGMNGGWTAWCASTSWKPYMFQGNWVLLTGQSEMGGFVKDWLYTHRDQ
jgi:hypothetical protein